MCAYNEESVIVSKAESLLAMAERYGPATIHVYVDAPSDGTADLLKPYGDRIDLVISETRNGKTFGMNLLVERSASEILLFTDANVAHEPDLLGKLIAPLADPEIGCCSARLVYSNREDSATAATGAAYWATEEWIKRIESASIGLVGVDGAMFAMRRALHRLPPPYLIDDLYLSLLIMIRGSRVVSEPSAVVYERSAVEAGEEFTRKRRIACQAINVHRELWPELRQMPALRLYGYVSHRLIKWLTPFLLGMAAIFLVTGATMALGWGVPLALTIAAIILSIASAAKIHLAQVVTTSLKSLAGVALGVCDAVVKNETYTVWNPAQSVRG